MNGWVLSRIKKLGFILRWSSYSIMNPVYEKDLRSLLNTHIGLVVWHITPRVSHRRPTDVLLRTACVLLSFSIL